MYATLQAIGRAANDRGADRWTVLRDRWEYSHIGRAALAAASLLTLLVALQRWPAAGG